MGEGPNQSFQLSVNRFLRAAFQGSRVTSDGGLILVRELDERFGLGKLIGQRLVDSHAGELFPRVGFIVTHPTLPSRAVVRFYTRGALPTGGLRRANRR